mgnify:CR=1 FL=1
MIDTVEAIADAVGAVKLIQPADFRPRRIKNLVTDSRSVLYPEETVFAAIQTRVGDGHNYICVLYSKGVRVFLVDRTIDTGLFPEAVFIMVHSVNEALVNLGRARLEDFENGIVITGSKGKTTVKELLYTSLLDKCDVCRSPRSWNSSIGVPLAVWHMTEGRLPDYMITEAGIDGPGQSRVLKKMLGQSHKTAIITPVTNEHDSEFTSHADKVCEKLAIVEDCTLIVYADSDPVLCEEIVRLQKNRPNLRAVAVGQGAHPTIFHALVDAVLREMGVVDIDVDSRTIVDTRREIQTGVFGNTIISDFFTPDLTSLREALDFMRRQSGSMENSVLMLGHLLPGRQETYEAAFAMASDYGISNVLCIAEGSEAKTYSILDRYHSGTLYRDSRILLFGADRAFADALCGAGHDTVLEVNLDAIIHNYNYYRRLLPAGTGIVGMVKASAYGMGAVEIGRTLQSQGAAYLAVAVVDEAVALRNAGITMPIMVLNPVTNQCPALFAYNIEPAVFSIDELKLLIETAAREGVSGFPIHIKLDTGMHRVGFIDEQLDELIECLRGQSSLRVASVFSHLATADCLDMDEYTRLQIDKFYDMSAKIRQGIGTDFDRHILNTAGMMRFADCGPYEMTRLGIGLYGVSPLPPSEAADLQTVATFKSRIISLKHWPAGTPIGYGCRGVTSRDSIVATVPVGYADGVNRRLGRGNASFVVRGVACPTIGNICMDLCMVDVTDAVDVAVGDEVEIFGPSASVEVLAETLGTIPYELFTWVSPRVRRIYYRK